MGRRKTAGGAANYKKKLAEKERERRRKIREDQIKDEVQKGKARLSDNIDTPNFLRDGPATQNRNSTVLYMLATQLENIFASLSNFTWNYFESGHDKGAADRVEAVCKRTADRILSRILVTDVQDINALMVATDEAPAQSAPESAGGTFGKLKQTLSSSLLTAQDKVTKMSPRPSLVPDPDGQSLYSSSSSDSQLTGQSQQQHQQQQANQNNNNNKAEPGKPPSRAGACRVCLKSFKPEDYSKTCFECQQRVCEDCASYSKLDENEDANMWRCSVCRRKMASRVCIPQDSTDSMLDVPVLEALQRRHSDVKLGSTQTLAPGNGVGLAPPRSPELRRHSDVSPASLKELEKLKGSKTPGGDLDWRKGGRSIAPSRSSSPPRRGDFDGPPPASRMSSRRASRVARQHSYDDDIKSSVVPTTAGAAPSDLGLGIPAMPRRKSAYDVFAPGILQAAAAQVAARSPADVLPTHVQPSSRRPSFRAPHPADDLPQKDDSPSPDKGSPVLTVEEDRRMRRRGSQLPDIAALRDRGAIPAAQLNPVPPPLAAFTGPALEDLEAPRRQTSMDGEAIKIVIHDVDSGPICASKRRVVLRRDPTDKAHRTRGFGMRVVGGKTGADGRLFAYIVWTVPGGPAEKGGLQQGDKILEWNGVSLIDRSFEEVCSIMDRTGDVVELLVEHATDFRMCDLLEDGVPPGSGGGNQSGPRKSGDGPIGLGLVADPEATDKSPSSPTRRKLPKTPEQIAREKQVSGRVQLQVWYHGERSELVVSLMAADDLAPRDDSYGHGSLPEGYAKVRILPKTGDGQVAQTEVSAPTLNPIWNATLTFKHISADNLMDRFIEIQLWDLVPHTESIFLGECNVELQKAFLEDRALWCRLEDPKGLRASSFTKSPSVSPRGSIAGGDVARLIRRNDYIMQRSISDDVDSIGDGTSLLHPDHAYIAGSRRGSSQSETLEVDTYQLSKDISRSLPGSRRSSFQDREENKDAAEATPPPQAYIRDRRRSSVARRDPDEILKSLKQVRGELGRAMSLSTGETKRTSSRRSSRARKDSVIGVTEFLPIGIGTNATSPPSDDDDKLPPRWKGSGNILASMAARKTSLKSTSSSTTNINKITSTTKSKEPYVTLGPGQIHPKGYRLTSGRYGELKLGLLKIKGVVEVEVISARNIVPVDCETPPDTYVKCYLKDGDRLRHKKKTRVVRHSAEPIYKQVLKYQSSDVFGRNLVIMVWQRCIGFEHNQGLGGAELSLDKLNLGQRAGGWYPLFPMHSFGSDSNDSP